MRRLWGVLTGIGLVCVGVGFLGRWHPAGDAWAVLRGGLCLVGLVWICLGWARGAIGARWAGPALAALVLALGTTLLPRWPVTLSGPPALTVYQKNMLYSTADTAPLARDILESGAEIATLQEVGRAGMSLRDQLAGEMPHWLRCAAAADGGTAIASRLPLREAACLNGMATARVETAGGPLRVVAIHLSWPWPWHQQAQGIGNAVRLADLGGPPLVIGGDFNAVPWTYLMREVQRITQTARAGALRETFPLVGALVDLPIDHVLLPAGWRGETTLRPQFGSDHLGLLVRARRP